MDGELCRRVLQIYGFFCGLNVCYQHVRSVEKPWAKQKIHFSLVLSGDGGSKIFTRVADVCRKWRATIMFSNDAIIPRLTAEDETCNL